MSERRVGPVPALAAAAFTAGFAVLVVPALLAAGAGQRTAQDGRERAREIARRVLAAQSTRGFVVRARVEVASGSESGSPPAVLQVRMLGRREKAADRLLFQVLWPDALKGHALVIERRGGEPRSGFLFDPPSAVTPLTPELSAAPFAGTGLTAEDLADDFWRWPAQRLAGLGRDGDRYCSLIESEPPSPAQSAYARVRSCVDTGRHAARWVEKLDAAGAVVKRIAFERPRSKSGGEGAQMAMTVEGPGVPRTRVEFVRQDRDVDVAPREFTLERLGRLGLAAPPRPPAKH